MSDLVLIVDDSLTVRMDLKEAFEAAGFRIAIGATVAEGRRALTDERPDVVVLDLLLPDGDGVELLQEVRSHPTLGSTPVIMLSSEAEIHDRIRGLKTGADDYVGKPYDTGYVVSRARELLRSRDGTAAPARTTILVIDDSPTFRDAMEEALGRVGYAVMTASSGEEGLRLATSVPPTAIIVDGVMPGIDGATVIRRIRLDAALRTTPCILLTASVDGGAELRALDAGADAFVRKEEDLEVILARVAAVLRSAAAEREDTTGLLGPKRILAVDDSPTYLNELAAMLREEGYDVVPARSGEEAIELIAVQQVDCILLDLLMPGLGGRETCKRIKASPVVRDIPLIILTALEDRDTMIDGLSLGADDYISKMSEVAVVKARVAAQLRRKQFEDAHRQVRERLLRSEVDAAEARAARQLAETKAESAELLERKNKELEAFSYSVSHDLRAPLRGIDGFSQALLEEYGAVLDDKGRDYLDRVRGAAQRMNHLIDALLALSRVGRSEVRRRPVDLSDVVRQVGDELTRRDPDRQVALIVEDNLTADADAKLMRVLFDNLVGNAWKFTGKTPDATIRFGVEERDGARAYVVRDNGAGFDMEYAENLFAPFQRLHRATDFPGTGIGLATVHRIVDRHGGRVWAESKVGAGAAFFFTLPVPTVAAHSS